MQQYVEVAVQKGGVGRYCGNAVYKSSNMDGVNVMVSSRSSCRSSCNVVTWVGYSYK
jgi:hypothetical protein